jgi:dihydrofolate reductase
MNRNTKKRSKIRCEKTIDKVQRKKKKWRELFRHVESSGDVMKGRKMFPSLGSRPLKAQIFKGVSLKRLT